MRSSIVQKREDQISIFYFLISVNAIHGNLTTIAKKLEICWLLFKGNHGAWITVYFIVAIAVVLLAARHFRLLWRYFRHETQIALSGAIAFVTGGVGFEIISYLLLRSGFTPNLYKVEVACEEFLEMSGVSIILYAVLLLSITISTKSPILEPEEITEYMQPLGWGEIVQNKVQGWLRGWSGAGVVPR